LHVAAGGAGARDRKDRPVRLRGKIAGSICHGGLVLISAGIVEGHRSTGSEGIKDDLINAGATWTNEEPAFRDGRIVSGRVVPDIPAVCREPVVVLSASSPCTAQRSVA